MLDDLQDFDDSAAFLDELEDLNLDDIDVDNDADAEQKSAPSPGRLIFGMNSPQRFIIAVELFILTLVLSSICLLVFNVISPPF